MLARVQSARERTTDRHPQQHYLLRYGLWGYGKKASACMRVERVDLTRNRSGECVRAINCVQCCWKFGATCHRHDGGERN